MGFLIPTSRSRSTDFVWSLLFLSHFEQSLRLPCYSLISLLPLPPRTHHPSSSSSFPPVSSSSSSSTSPYLAPLSTALHTLSLELIRFASIVIVIPSLKPHPHPHGDGGDGNESVYPDVWLQWQSFGAAYWLGLGWALGEVGIGVWQGSLTSSSCYRSFFMTTIHSFLVCDSSWILRVQY